MKNRNSAQHANITLDLIFRGSAIAQGSCSKKQVYSTHPPLPGILAGFSDTCGEGSAVRIHFERAAISTDPCRFRFALAPWRAAEQNRAPRLNRTGRAGRLASCRCCADCQAALRAYTRTETLSGLTRPTFCSPRGPHGPSSGKPIRTSSLVACRHVAHSVAHVRSGHLFRGQCFSRSFHNVQDLLIQCMAHPARPC
jgi:hypothetical protein